MATDLATLLQELKACLNAREWCADKTLRQAWETSERGDWLLWLCARMVGKPGWPTHQEVVLAACDCAETALKFVPEGEDRPRKCLEVTRAWATGNASLAEVSAAYATATAAAAYATATATYAAAAYAYASAAISSATASDSAYDATSAATSAATASDAAYDSAAYFDAAYDSAYARALSLKESANIVRKRLSIPEEWPDR